MSSWDFEPLDLNPYGSSWDFPAPTLGRRASQDMTMLQLLALLEARNADKGKKSSFTELLKGAGKSIANPVLWSFDKIMRPSYGMASAAQAGLRGDDNDFDIGEALHGYREGFMGRNKIGMGEVLDEHGVLKNHNFLRGLAGFGLDVATDPLTYATFGVGGAVKGGAQTGIKAIMKELPKVGAGRATILREGDEINNALRELTQLGSNYSNRVALGKQKLTGMNSLLTGEGLDDSYRASLSLARAAAKAEERAFDPRQFRAEFRIPLTNKRLGANTGIKVPKTKIGDLNIPMLSRTAATLGKAFKPGYEDPVGYATALSKRHIGERLSYEYMHELRKRFDGVEALPEKQQIDAISYFEDLDEALPPAVVKQGDDYILNPERIAGAKAAGLSDKQIQFADAMHGMGRMFAGKHRDYRVDFEDMAEKGQFYVPRIVDKKKFDGLTDVQTNLLTKRGFLKDRASQLTMRQLKYLADKGELPAGIETNPHKLMAMHARSVANEHADASLRNYLSDNYGMSKRVVDMNQLHEVYNQRAALQETLEKADALLDESRWDKAYASLKTKHKKAAQKELQAATTRNRELIRHHLEGDWTRTTLATVQKLSNHSTTLQTKYRDRIAAIDAGTDKALAREAKPLLTAKAGAGKVRGSVERKIKSLDKAERVIRRGTKNPAIKPGTMTTVKKLKDAQGHPLVFPKEIAHQIERLEAIVHANDETLEAFSNGFRKWIGKWKLAVTSLNVGSYGVRNTLSDFWNMYLAGIPMSQMVRFGGEAATLMRKAKIGDPDAIHELMQAYDAGVLSGLFAGDVQQIAHMLEHSGSKRALVKQKRFIKLATKVTQDINRNRENWGRMTHYLYRRRTQGMSVQDAAFEVRKAHFDYEELTEFEQKAMKTIAPFYTWSRKNIPYQIQMLFSAPGRMAAFPKFANEMNQASGGSEGELVPEYMQKGMYLKMPFGGGKYTAPMIGVTDLMRATNPKDLATGSLTPAIKAPVELLMNKSFLTGQEIAGEHPRNPVNELVAPLLSLLPGANVGQTSRPAPGGQAYGTGASPWVGYLAGLMPFTNTLVNQTGSIKAAQRGGDAYKPAVSWLTGLNANSVDQEQQREFALAEFQAEMERYIRGLRDEGVIPEAKKRKKSKNQREVELALLEQLMG